MVGIFCCLLLFLQGTLSASLPENTDRNQTSESFFIGLITGTSGQSTGLEFEKSEKLPENEVDTQNVYIPEDGLILKQAFYAFLSSGRCYHTGDIIKFDRAPVNIATRYSVHTGVYVVPTSGIYSFTWTVAAEKKTWFVTELRVNGVVKGNIMTDSDVNGLANGIHPATGFAMVNVNHGDHVYIRFKAGYGCRVKSDQMTRTTFSGWRVS